MAGIANSQGQLVQQYQSVMNEGEHWRTWKLTKEELNLPEQINNQPWIEDINKCRVKIKHGHDILHQGYSTTSNVLVKEAYYLKSKVDLINKDTLWDKIWHNGYWHKVISFL